MERSAWGISSAGLKWLAMAVMLIDHLGWLLCTGDLYTLMRIVGRGAFPIFCFLLVQGAQHTRNRARYALRLLLCGLVSEPLFDLLFMGSPLYLGRQNVLWTLLLGYGGICGALWLEQRPMFRDGAELPRRAVCVLLECLLFAAAAVAAWGIGSDYGWYGAALIGGLFLLRRHRPMDSLWLLLLSAYYGGLQVWAGWAAVPMLLYSGEKGRGSRWFYLFYPAHMFALWLLQAFLVSI